MSLWGLLTGLRSKIAMLTGLGMGFPGGVFKVRFPIYSGGRFGSAHFGIDTFRAIESYAWQMAPLMVQINGSWYSRPLYRWDVAQNAWLQVEVLPQPTGTYGRWDISKWGENTWR